MSVRQLHARPGQVGNNRRRLHAALNRRGPGGINLLYCARLINPCKVEPRNVHATGYNFAHDTGLFARRTDGCDYLCSCHISVFSISISLVYFWLRSGLVGAPAFIYSHPSPTATSAIHASSVSPERCEAIAFQPCACAEATAAIVSLTVPTWFGLIMTASIAFFCAAKAMRAGFVTVRSSPTTSVSPADARNAAKSSQSSSVNGSSIETSGYFFSIDAYHADIFSLSKCSILLAAISSANLHRLAPERTHASDSNSSPSSLFFRRGENPPSSPREVSYPFSASRARSDSTICCADSTRCFTPDSCGTIIYSCIATPLRACLPPLITLNIGAGIAKELTPAKPPRYRCNSTFCSAAAARANAIEMPSSELPPSRDFSGVPSSVIKKSSSDFWSNSLPTSATLTSVLIWATAIVGSTTFASWMPTEAPDGTDAVPSPPVVLSVTSIVGLPRESAIVLAESDSILCTKPLYH